MHKLQCYRSRSTLISSCISILLTMLIVAQPACKPRRASYLTNTGNARLDDQMVANLPAAERESLADIYRIKAIGFNKKMASDLEECRDQLCQSLALANKHQPGIAELRNDAATASDPKVRWIAAAELFEIASQLSDPSEAQRVRAGIIPGTKNGISRFQLADMQFALLKAYEMMKIAPAEVVSHLGLLKSWVDEIPASFGTDLLQQQLILLILHGQLLSNVTQEFGRPPRIERSALLSLNNNARQHLSNLRSLTYDLKNSLLSALNPNNAKKDFVPFADDRIICAVAQSDFGEDAANIQQASPEACQAAKQVLPDIKNGINEIEYAIESIILYSDRLNQIDWSYENRGANPSDWLDRTYRRVVSGELSAVAFARSLIDFWHFEMLLPHREKWIGTLEQLLNHQTLSGYYALDSARASLNAMKKELAEVREAEKAQIIALKLPERLLDDGLMSSYNHLNPVGQARYRQPEFYSVSDYLLKLQVLAHQYTEQARRAACASESQRSNYQSPVNETMRSAEDSLLTQWLYGVCLGRGDEALASHRAQYGASGSNSRNGFTGYDPWSIQFAGNQAANTDQDAACSDDEQSVDKNADHFASRTESQATPIFQRDWTQVAYKVCPTFKYNDVQQRVLTWRKNQHVNTLVVPAAINAAFISVEIGTAFASLGLMSAGLRGLRVLVMRAAARKAAQKTALATMNTASKKVVFKQFMHRIVQSKVGQGVGQAGVMSALGLGLHASNFAPMWLKYYILTGGQNVIHDEKAMREYLNGFYWSPLFMLGFPIVNRVSTSILTPAFQKFAVLGKPLSSFGKPALAGTPSSYIRYDAISKSSLTPHYYAQVTGQTAYFTGTPFLQKYTQIAWAKYADDPNKKKRIEELQFQLDEMHKNLPAVVMQSFFMATIFTYHGFAKGHFQGGYKENPQAGSAQQEQQAVDFFRALPNSPLQKHNITSMEQLRTNSGAFTELKAFFKNISRQTHPDRTGNNPEQTALFKKVQESWSIINKSVKLSEPPPTANSGTRDPSIVLLITN